MGRPPWLIPKCDVKKSTISHHLEKTSPCTRLHWPLSELRRLLFFFLFHWCQWQLHFHYLTNMRSANFVRRKYEPRPAVRSTAEAGRPTHNPLANKRPHIHITTTDHSTSTHTYVSISQQRDPFSHAHKHARTPPTRAGATQGPPWAVPAKSWHAGWPDKRQAACTRAVSARPGGEEDGLLAAPDDDERLQLGHETPA